MESATASEYYQSAAYCSAGAEKRQFSSDNKAGEHFVVEEFLDFSNDEDNAAADAAAALDASAGCGAAGGHSADSVVDSSCNSSSFSGCDPNFVADIGCRSFAHGQFSSDLCVPYDDIAEMEWLSNIVEESFSSEDLQRLQLISGIKARSAETNAATNHLDESSETAPNNYITNTLQSGRDHDHHDHHDHHVVMASVPAKARSKRSRAPPCNWTSRLLLLSSSSSSSTASSSPEASEASAPPPTPMLIKPMMAAAAGKKGAKKKDAEAAMAAGEGGGGMAGAGEGRKCLHCATDKTPQWRTGPMGPKTLCNACGVRYKSGRLVPEYRPAASPTFVLTKHSNSHRKVLELRRQKDMVRAQHHHQFIHSHHQQQDINGGAVAFDRHYHHHHHAPSSSNGGEEYLIHHHVGPDFRQMI